MRYNGKKMMVALMLVMMMLLAVACGTVQGSTDAARIAPSAETKQTEAIQAEPMTAVADGKAAPLLTATSAEDADAHKLKQFTSFTGTIKEVNPHTDADGQVVEGKFTVLAENDEGAEMNFIVSEDTIRIQDGSLTAGEAITGWYDTTRPAIAIYPPQQSAVAIVLGQLTDGQSVVVDRFDKDMLSYDSQLKLNISDAVEIVLPNGDAFTGELADRKLIVVYSVVTMSIPAQTTPSKIIVLYEDVTTGPMLIDHGTLLGDNPTYVVNDETIDAPAPHISAANVLMVPLRAIAEALGYNVFYDEEATTMRLGNAASVTVGDDNYTMGRMAPIELGAAPELVDGEVYVPLAYFPCVLGMDSAYALDGQIVVESTAPPAK
jgi:hypothetical protein